MNDLVDKLEEYHINYDIEDLTIIDSKYSVLKCNSTVLSQEERRKEKLKKQYEQKLEKIYEKKDLEWSESEDDDDLDEERVKYKGWLMLSEWMFDVPADIESEWFCVICPQGRRVLVVAHNFKTNAYARNGSTIASSFQTFLPGGSQNSAKGFTVLDAIFNDKTNTFYILDIIHWGTMNTESLEAHFRFYWLKGKMGEVTQMGKREVSHAYNFELLQNFPFSELNAKMKVFPAFPNNLPITDGILFFHSETEYVRGFTPLCLWLKPFMIPDILDITVAEEYHKERPPEYEGIANMQIVKANLKCDSPEELNVLPDIFNIAIFE